MNKAKHTPLLWLFAAVGVICSIILLAGRLIAEYNDRSVSVAVSYKHVLTLASESGRKPSEWLADLSSIGVAHLIVTDDNEQQAKSDLGDISMSIARSGDTARSTDSFLIPEMRDGYVFAYDEPAGDLGVPLSLVENPFRTDVVMPDSFDPDMWQGPMVKTLYMFDAYSYHWKMQQPATENENILFRAVTDRGMRLIILTPLVDESKNIVSDFDAYSDLISGLEKRISARGITLGDTFSAMDAPVTSPYLIAGALMLLIAVSYLLLSALFKLDKKLEYIILPIAAVIAFAGSLLFTGLVQKLGAFAASVVFPCFSALLFVRTSKAQTEHSLLVRFTLSLLSMLAIGLTGGLYVGALLASRPYMMQFEIFSGVKLSSLLPLAFTAAILAFTLFNKKSRGEIQVFQKPPTALLVFIGVCVTAALVVLILRSGDNMLPVSDIEVGFRNLLEYFLYARPRTKEMFLAFPALALYIVASDRRIPLFQLPLGILASIGACSVVNTFCHIFTPVHVSVIRTFISVGFGFVVGVIGMYLFSLLLGKKQKI